MKAEISCFCGDCKHWKANAKNRLMGKCTMMPCYAQGQLAYIQVGENPQVRGYMWSEQAMTPEFVTSAYFGCNMSR